jgi:hypothetical protein
MNPNTGILAPLSEEFSRHVAIPQDESLQLAANAALQELKRHGVREWVTNPLVDLPLHQKIRFLVDVLVTVPDNQFKKLIQINGRLDWALDAIMKRMQVLRVCSPTTSSATPIWRSRISDL